MIRKHRLVLAGAVVAALATGGGVALAAGGKGPGHGGQLSFRGMGMGSPLLATMGGHMGFAGHMGFGRGDGLQAAADYLGISTATLLSDLQSGKTLAQVADSTSGKSSAGLVAALVAQEKSELDAAVKAGKLTQAQEDAIVASLQQRVTDMVDGVRPPMPFGGHGLGHHGDGLQAAADYLGISTATLLADLQSGKTLAQVADATSGKSSAGLIAALVAHEKSELDAAVTAGRLTQAQEDAIVASLQQRVTDMVNGVRPPMPFGGHHGGWGGGPNA